MTDWRDISTAPKDGSVFLAVMESAALPEANVTWWDGARWMAYVRSDKFFGGTVDWTPTHWMPRPAPPGSAPVPSLVDDAIDALRKWNAAFEGLFAHCVSNGVFNQWGRQMNCTALNEAHETSDAVLRRAGK